MTGLTEINGVRVGQWTDAVGLTGCSVVLLPAGSVASGEVRGGAPGSREWALLDPGGTVSAVDAVVLTGGSAFGLAACDGVMAWCEEQGRGWPTPAGPVPIVVGLVLYDLTAGDPSARPGRAEGYLACRQATAEPVPSGVLGAGTGATTNKWRGPTAIKPGGLGSASQSDGDLIVAALVAVNAIGGIRPATGPPVPLTPWPSPPSGPADADGTPGAGINTT
ncbi:MAG: P1 family peptidase, partial [Actinomycetota bacterium]|nr:P1 family peptidase [Actinomycetota bacterium]